MLSFPDASGNTPVKSTRGEFSSPLDSGFHPSSPSVHDSRMQHGPALNPAWTESSSARCFCWFGKQDVVFPTPQVRTGDKDAALCNDESGRYPEVAAAGAAERRTGSGGRYVAASRRRRDARMGEHGAAATGLGCAPIRRSILLSSHSAPLLRAHRMRSPYADTRLEKP